MIRRLAYVVYIVVFVFLIVGACWVVMNYRAEQAGMDGGWARFRAYWAKPDDLITREVLFSIALVVIACLVILVRRLRKKGGGG